VVATVGRARARSWIECVVGYLRDQGNRSCRSNGLAVLASSKGGGSGIRASPAESKSGPCRPSVSVVVCPSFSVRSLADRRGQCSTKKKSRPCHKLAVELVSRVPPCPSSKPENQTPIKKDCRLPPPSFNLIFLLTTIWHKVLFISLDPPTQ